MGVSGRALLITTTRMITARAAAPTSVFVSAPRGMWIARIRMATGPEPESTGPLVSP